MYSELLRARAQMGVMCPELYAHCYGPHMCARGLYTSKNVLMTLARWRTHGSQVHPTCVLHDVRTLRIKCV